MISRSDRFRPLRIASVLALVVIVAPALLGQPDLGVFHTAPEPKPVATITVSHRI